MSNKNIYTSIVFIIFIMGVMLLYVMFNNTDLATQKPTLEMFVEADRASSVQLFVQEGNYYNPENHSEVKWSDPLKLQKIKLEIPEVQAAGKIRIDIGYSRSKWKIKTMTFKGKSNTITYGPDEIIKLFKPIQHIETFKANDQGVLDISVTGHDAFIESNFYLQQIMPTLLEDRFPNFKILFLSIVFSLFFSVLIFYMLVKWDPLKQASRKDALFISTFLIFISTPFIVMVVYPNQNLSENRRLAEKPLLTTKDMLSYPEAYNKYFKENFGFRKWLTTLNSYWRLKIFNSSSAPESVIIGKNSWLYSTDPDISGDFRNRIAYTKEELNIIQKHIEELHHFYAKNNIPFYLFIVPSKYNIYPEYLPNRITINIRNTKLDQLISHMNKYSEVKIITAHEELIKAKINAPVFYEHDTHWNLQGGFIGYQKLMKTIVAKFPHLQILHENEFNRNYTSVHNADLSRMLSLEDVLLNDEWGFQKKFNSLTRPGQKTVFQTISPIQPTLFIDHPQPNLPKAVIYRDSFFNLMIPFMGEHFSRSVLIWSYDHSVEVIEKEKPDVIIMEIIENRLDKFLENNRAEFQHLPSAKP